MSPFAILLAVHVTLAIALVVPTIVLPFAVRTGRAGRRRPDAPTAGDDGRGPLVGSLVRLQGTGSLVVGAGLAATGAALVVTLGPTLLGQPWLVAALALYATTMAVAFFVQRPWVRGLLRLGPSDDAALRDRARRGRYVSYLMAGLVGTIGMLMSAKPELW